MFFGSLAVKIRDEALRIADHGRTPMTWQMFNDQLKKPFPPRRGGILDPV
jgi:hypothetical protein